MTRPSKTPGDTAGSLRPWSRERLIATTIALALTVLVLVTGLTVAVARLLLPPSPNPQDPAPAAVGEDRAGKRDRIAAEPMLAVTREDALRGEPAVAQLDPLVVPEPSILRGPAGVATGFPHTPEGAVGQLAALEAAVLEGMNLDDARTIHGEWVADGGPAFGDWVLTRAVQSFLGALGGAQERLPERAVVKVRPTAGLVKGTDGPDWVLACVLLDVQATYQQQARVGFGHCEPMEWDGTRWRIAAGPVPAFAPSTWPGSVKAVEAGWRPWQVEGVEE